MTSSKSFYLLTAILSLLSVSQTASAFAGNYSSIYYSSAPSTYAPSASSQVSTYVPDTPSTFVYKTVISGTTVTETYCPICEESTTTIPKFETITVTEGEKTWTLTRTLTNTVTLPDETQVLTLTSNDQTYTLTRTLTRTQTLDSITSPEVATFTITDGDETYTLTRTLTQTRTLPESHLTTVPFSNYTTPSISTSNPAFTGLLSTYEGAANKLMGASALGILTYLVMIFA